jgi:predicted phosphodiesterase
MVLDGVISETHGLMRMAALAALKGADLIVHEGDAGKREVLDQLREIAPLHAVRGNIDVKVSAREPPQPGGMIDTSGHHLSGFEGRRTQTRLSLAEHPVSSCDPPR